jgi:hypothetical protein
VDDLGVSPGMVARGPRGIFRIALSGLAIGLVGLVSLGASAREVVPASLPYWPDCDVHAACLCPWRSVLHMSDLQTLPANLAERLGLPQSAHRSHQREQCWTGAMGVPAAH